MTFRIHCKVDQHALDVIGENARWSVAVDGDVLPGRFKSQADALAAGQYEVERAQRESRSARPASPPAEHRVQAPPATPEAWEVDDLLRMRRIHDDLDREYLQVPKRPYRRQDVGSVPSLCERSSGTDDP
jgi:hypothetical protein